MLFSSVATNETMGYKSPTFSCLQNSDWCLSEQIIFQRTCLVSFCRAWGTQLDSCGDLTMEPNYTSPLWPQRMLYACKKKKKKWYTVATLLRSLQKRLTQLVTSICYVLQANKLDVLGFRDAEPQTELTSKTKLFDQLWLGLQNAHNH